MIQAQESKSQVHTHEFYSAMRIKTHFDKSLSLQNLQLVIIKVLFLTGSEISMMKYINILLMELN